MKKQLSGSSYQPDANALKEILEFRLFEQGATKFIGLLDKIWVEPIQGIIITPIIPINRKSSNNLPDDMQVVFRPARIEANEIILHTVQKTIFHKLFWKKSNSDGYHEYIVPYNLWLISNTSRNN